MLQRRNRVCRWEETWWKAGHRCPVRCLWDGRRLDPKSASTEPNQGDDIEIRQRGLTYLLIHPVSPPVFIFFLSWVLGETEEHIFPRPLQLCEHIPSPMGESTVECSQLESMPDVSFTIGDRSFVLTPDQVLYVHLGHCSVWYFSWLPKGQHPHEKYGHLQTQPAITLPKTANFFLCFLL